MTRAEIAADEAVENYAIEAREAGIPAGQFKRFITGGYVAIDNTYLQFHAACREADSLEGPTEIALGGKRGPGKSHVVMAQIGLDDCQRVPRLKVLFLRKIQKAASESLEDLIYRVFRHTPHQYVQGKVTFENDSRIIIGGFKDERDIDKYLGIEYDIIVIEEVTQITEEKYEKLLGSLRSSKTGWKPRIYLSTNADGVGLAWFKRRFLLPYRADKQTRTRFYDVTHVRNPFINPDYHDWLDTLTGALRKAWRDGDWDAFAGMAFPMWNYDTHVIEPFDIPEHWVIWRALDWGYAAPFACLWFTKDPDTRRIYVIREAYKDQLTASRQAQLIKDMTLPTEKPIFTFADPALWARKDRNDEVYTTAKEYSENGVPLTKADNDRINGKRKVDEILSLAPDGLPALQIFNHCDQTIDQLANLPRDDKNPEDVDTDAPDHAYDALRYGLTNEKRVVKKPPRKYKDRSANVSVL